MTHNQPTDECVSRNSDGTPQLVTDIVDSPDDGGFYLQQTDFSTGQGRVSARIYSSRTEAARALQRGKVRWERWS